MEMNQIKYFLSVVTAGSFSAAAQELHLSQSSLSKQIIALERELDVILFDRSKRRVSLTQAGIVFSKHAMSLHEAYQSMLTDLKEYRKAAPSLSIAALPVIAHYGIMSLVEQFKNMNPQLDFTLEEREASTILPALDHRQYDLAFVRDNYLDKDQYASLNIYGDRLLVAVSNKHRFASCASLCLAELAEENFIMYKQGSVVRRLAEDACRSAGFEPRVFYSSLRGASIMGLVASNRGIALMMEKVLDYYKHPGVVSIPLVETIESRIVLAYPRTRQLSRPARAFLEFIAKLSPSD